MDNPPTFENSSSSDKRFSINVTTVLAGKIIQLLPQWREDEVHSFLGVSGWSPLPLASNLSSSSTDCQKLSSEPLLCSFCSRRASCQNNLCISPNFNLPTQPLQTLDCLSLDSSSVAPTSPPPAALDVVDTTLSHLTWAPLHSLLKEKRDNVRKEEKMNYLWSLSYILVTGLGVFTNPLNNPKK